ncbi:MAG: leucine-rich repeat domain-containing protein [Holophagales bacterium]|nr:leucine-rich repeat domain-containing protein [Holophagales bacterium]MYG30738.1 leucine-rich repeat domain-containing protein [Holophagales bacterium]
MLALVSFRADGQGICGRTPEVRDAILAEVGGTCRTVTAEWLKTVRHLQVLSPSLAALRAGDFEGLAKLESLLITSRRLSSVAPGTFDGLFRLEALFLSGKDLSGLPAGVFRDLSRLRALGIGGLRRGGSGLRDIPPGMFDGLVELDSLSLGSSGGFGLPVASDYGNSLTSLPPHVFDGLPKLWSLDLSGNALESLPSDVFLENRSLSYVDLRNNNLRALPRGLFPEFRKTYVDVRGNPGAPLELPLVFYQESLRSDGAFDLFVHSPVRLSRDDPLEVVLSATGGTLSAYTLTLQADPTTGRGAGRTVTIFPNQDVVTVTATPASHKPSKRGYTIVGATYTLCPIRPDVPAPVACLVNGRFRVEVEWRSEPDDRGGVGTMRRRSRQTAVSTFFEEENVEALVKILDGTGVNGRFWVYSGGLSDLEYTLSVTDRHTGVVKEYRNEAGGVCGQGDTDAFGPSPFRTWSPDADEGDGPLEPPPEHQDGQGSGCPANALCLQNGRFQVTATWTVAAAGEKGVGTPIPDTDSTGYMWFFSPGNVELVLKVLDGRSFNDSWWFFASALSDVDYTVHVLDTDTGLSRTYTNNPDRPFCGFGDTSAFPE